MVVPELPSRAGPRLRFFPLLPRPRGRSLRHRRRGPSCPPTRRESDLDRSRPYGRDSCPGSGVDEPNGERSPSPSPSKDSTGYGDGPQGLGAPFDSDVSRASRFPDHQPGSRGQGPRGEEGWWGRVERVRGCSGVVEDEDDSRGSAYTFRLMSSLFRLGPTCPRRTLRNLGALSDTPEDTRLTLESSFYPRGSGVASR